MNIEEQRKLACANRFKYLKSPTIKEIDDFIKELDVSDYQFERFFSIPISTISQVRLGLKKLPARFWHIVYEKVVPSYSISHQELRKSAATKTTTRPHTQEKESTKIESPMEDPRLSRFLT